MGIRFRRSVKVAPGLRLNFSGSGMSLTAGPRGASLNFGGRGTYLNTGIPGTGLYSRTRLDSPVAANSQHRGNVPTPQIVKINVRINLDDEGRLTFEYDGKPASDYVIRKAKRDHGDAIRQMIAETCEKMNGLVKSLATIHVTTPAPTARVQFVQRIFEEAPPKPPVPQTHGVLGWLFKKVAARIDAENNAAVARHRELQAEWETRRAAFEEQEGQRKTFLETSILTDTSAMEKHLEQALLDIHWPRETHVSFELLEGGKAISIDVDLPEIGDMPRKTWSLPSHSFKPTIRDLGQPQLQKLYADHVQGVGFRIVGETFAVLPSMQTITLSAYTQRPNPATAAVEDAYVYSVRVTRENWCRINFQNLESLDVGEALGQFELHRDMTKNYEMRAVQPFDSMGERSQRESL